MSISLPKILITGGDGQLAQAILNHADAGKYKLIVLSKSKLDITNSDNVKYSLETFSPDIIINTAAYTAVDKAEADEDTAMHVNRSGAFNLALLSQQFNIPLIHVSTDYVFDGKKTSPYTEEDQPNPINIYGMSKLKGEEEIRKYSKQYIILRVSGIFSEYGNNFANTMLKLANEKKELRVVDDQITCPTYAGDIATTLLDLANHPLNTGTYHYCGAEPLSWCEFASKLIGEKTRIHPISSKEYLAAAKRPSFSALNCNKILKYYQIKTEPLNERISHVIKKSCGK